MVFATSSGKRIGLVLAMFFVVLACVAQAAPNTLGPRKIVGNGKDPDVAVDSQGYLHFAYVRNSVVYYTKYDYALTEDQAAINYLGYYNQPRWRGSLSADWSVGAVSAARMPAGVAALPSPSRLAETFAERASIVSASRTAEGKSRESRGRRKSDSFSAIPQRRMSSATSNPSRPSAALARIG